MLAMAVIGIAAQACLIRGYALGEASALAVYDYARLPFAALFGYLLFAEWPDLAAMLGALLIASSTLYIARHDARHAVAAGKRR
jgi:drug/metabolite transporter (DMT)-like permease